MSKNAICKILLLILIALDSVLIYKFVEYRSEVNDKFKQQLQGVTIKAANDIDLIVRQVASSSTQLANTISSGSLSERALKTELKNLVSSSEYFYGGSVTYKAFSFDSDKRLHSLYFSKPDPDKPPVFLKLDEMYDYTLPDYDWYVDALQKGDRWSSPYWDAAGKTYMITYSALFYAKPEQTNIEQAIGVVTIDMSMATIRNIIESLKLDASGFGALTTKEGDYLYHPNYQYVREHLNLLDVAKEKGDTTRLKIAPKIKLGQSGVEEHISTTTKEEAWLFYQPIPHSNWSLQNTFFKSNLKVSAAFLRQQLILIIVVSIALISVFLFLTLPDRSFGYSRLSLICAADSVLFILCIWIVWWLALTYNDTLSDKRVERVTDSEYLDVLVSDFQNENTQKSLNTPYFIPTGILIETLNFAGPNDVSISGRIWQTYPANYPEDWVKGFELGRSITLNTSLIEKRKVEEGEVFYWRFQTVVRSDLDYSRYPLEVENINLPIYPKKNGDKVALIPDLKAYKFISPALLPGLTEKMFVPGWNITQSYFTFFDGSLTTNLGGSSHFDQKNFYELHFNVGLKRLFVDAFISNLTPLIVVVIILFSVVLLPTSIDISRTLSICVSVFFVVIFSHLSIRRAISSDSIFYLEYFYLVIYLMVIISPMNSFRATIGMPIKWLDHQNGLLLKLLFWPVVLLLFFAITTITFY
jgi:hypothetical protein